MKKLIFIAVATVMSASSAFAQQTLIQVPSITAPVVQTQVSNTTQVPIAASVGILGNGGPATATATNTTTQTQQNLQTLFNIPLGANLAF